MKLLKAHVIKFARTIGIIILGTVFILSFSCFNYTKLGDKDIIKKLTNENSKLKALHENDLKTIDNLRNSSYRAYNEAINPDFSWANNSKWDKIFVTNVLYPKNRVEIKDKAFLNLGTGNNYFGLFNFINSISVPPNGFITDENSYIYEFMSGKKTYIIRTYGSSVIQYNGNYYQSYSDIGALGKAFLPYPRFVNTGSVLYKMYMCVAIKEEEDDDTFLAFDSFHSRAVANYIQMGLESKGIKLNKNSLSQKGEWEDKLTFYHYGQNIIINIYEYYFSIKDGNNTYWYKTSNDFNIMNVLNAG